ncbi:MAG: pentapeptide repeat-containing protein [Methylibium sp.]|uniref:pentapeptide repeat-containing protein n=1 Tax=Methylibium sp. TaxID=2067992 RepID=UPI001815F7CC|nr:pentapeptide repeat-containing protein [Methylibium sp.]MBA3596219.1 pentapeptide repeat-containing protein [Methylibium sp.]
MVPENTPPEYAHLKIGNRETITDYYVPTHVSDDLKAFALKVFVRLNAKSITFRNVSFTHSVIDGCYLRSCVFDSCDFTGCRFIGSNLHQSNFPGCKFDYATFERCQIDDDILSSEAPRQENLRMRFARSLRMNYQQIGDAKAVNKAITLELEATSEHLLESWYSDSPYHRKKYPGLLRVAQFLHWIEFWILHFVWGNGESIFKLLRSIVIAVVIIAIYDAGSLSAQVTLYDYWDSLKLAPGIFLGTVVRAHHSIGVASIIVATKLVALSLLTALLVKRFGRR